MPGFRNLDDVDLRGKRVLVRVDFNVPMQDGEVTDATRIERAAATLKELMGEGAKVVALSHFGRPNESHPRLRRVPASNRMTPAVVVRPDWRQLPESALALQVS